MNIMLQDIPTSPHFILFLSNLF